MNLGFKLNAEQIAETYQDLAGYKKEIRPAIRRGLRTVSLAGMQRIKNEMPVDTGRAKAGWGKYTPQDLNKGAVRVLPAGKTPTSKQWSRFEVRVDVDTKLNGKTYSAHKWMGVEVGHDRLRRHYDALGPGSKETSDATIYAFRDFASFLGVLGGRGKPRIPKWGRGSRFFYTPGAEPIGGPELGAKYQAQVMKDYGVAGRTLVADRLPGRSKDPKKRTAWKDPVQVAARGVSRYFQNLSEESDAIWIDKSVGDTSVLEIQQGTRVQYVPKLEMGSSEQAPKGFISRAARWMQVQLPKEVGKELDAVFAKRTAAYRGDVKAGKA